MMVAGDFVGYIAVPLKPEKLLEWGTLDFCSISMIADWAIDYVSTRWNEFPMK
jgi:hypothetical protein